MHHADSDSNIMSTPWHENVFPIAGPYCGNPQVIKYFPHKGVSKSAILSLQWRHNGHGDVSNRQPRDSLLNRLFKRRSKKTLKLRVTGLCAGNSPRPVNSPHKWPVTRKMYPFIISLGEILRNSRVACERDVWILMWRHPNVLSRKL